MSTKKTLSRDDAAQLYKDLQKAMGTLKSKKNITSFDEIPTTGQAKSVARSNDGSTLPIFGPRGVLSFVLMLAIARAALSGLDMIGVTDVSAAMAVGNMPPSKMQVSLSDGLSREEVYVLTNLDSRRVELEGRSKSIEGKERELQVKEKELTAKIGELKNLTQKLNDNRTKNDIQRAAQIEQLANVYGSMTPNEAASLMEQLDLSISLDLIAKMPEKRVAQILAIMSKEKALQITKVLSGKR